MLSTEGLRSGVLRRVDATSDSNFIRRPTVQRELFKPAGKLNVTADGFARFVDAKANKRDLKAIAQESKGVQHDSLFAIGTGENIVDFVDNKNLNTEIRNADCTICAMSARGRCGPPRSVSSSA